ncbi:hypothetical protein SAMN05444747_1291 [Variovorax sp. OV329]|nr:hypothetical protein SAMN05444747_1291 [Variovorax sp. OV329]
MRSGIRSSVASSFRRRATGLSSIALAVLSSERVAAVPPRGRITLSSAYSPASTNCASRVPAARRHGRSGVARARAQRQPGSQVAQRQGLKACGLVDATRGHTASACRVDESRHVDITADAALRAGGTASADTEVAPVVDRCAAARACAEAEIHIELQRGETRLTVQMAQLAGGALRGMAGRGGCGGAEVIRIDEVWLCAQPPGGKRTAQRQARRPQDRNRKQPCGGTTGPGQPGCATEAPHEK